METKEKDISIVQKDEIILSYTEEKSIIELKKEPHNSGLDKEKRQQWMESSNNMFQQRENMYQQEYKLVPKE